MIQSTIEIIFDSFQILAFSLSYNLVSEMVKLLW